MNTLTSNFKIDNYDIYEPHLQIAESVESMLDENSGTTADGKMHVRWVRDKVHKFTLQYNLMTEAEYEYMKGLLLGKTFVFTYPENGQATSRECYCTAYGGVLTSIGYTSVQFEITEL